MTEVYSTLQHIYTTAGPNDDSKNPFIEAVCRFQIFSIDRLTLEVI